MNVALNYCWKEWRAQRGMLIGYMLLMTACLCLGLFLAPRNLWLDPGFSARALTWFGGAGVLGVLMFAVPNLVSREFVGKDDQFVRRLPGALLPAFVGKLLFLLVVTATLPQLGLLTGKLFVAAMGWGWHGWFSWRLDQLEGVGVALLMIPWLWAVGLWLPGGRLALLGTVLLALLVLVGVFAVERQAPKIFDGVAWWQAAWAVPVVGVAVAALSWCRGRRGGGPARSARVGLIATAVALLPFAGWVTERAMRFHYPDANQLKKLTVFGMSPDGRFALARGAEELEWYGVELRIDLKTGEATRVAGIHATLTPQVVYPAPLSMQATQRYWREYGLDDKHYVLDLVKGIKHPIAYDHERHEPQLPAQLLREVRAEIAGAGGFVAPDGRRVLLDHDELVFVSSTGEEERIAFPVVGAKSTRASGHAVQSWGAEGKVCFDLARREVLEVKGMDGGRVVGPSLLFSKDASRSHETLIRRADGVVAPCQALTGGHVLGLLDHDRVLVSVYALGGKRDERLFAFDPATGEESDFALPDDLSAANSFAVAPMHASASLLQRDPAGAIWLLRRDCWWSPFVRLNPQTMEARPVAGLCELPETRPRTMPHAMLLRWQELPYVVIQNGKQIVRVHIETGEREVLFPRK